MLERKPFTTDGCSGGMSWFWETFFNKLPPWEDLCIKHDREYWHGGYAEQRYLADVTLYYGVVLKGYPKLGRLMFWAVRIGGHPIWPFPWRWGYGYPYFKSFLYRMQVK